jgi:hypothetical protein
MNTTMRSAPDGCANISAANPPRNGTYVAAHTPADTSRTVSAGPAGRRQNTTTSTVAAYATARPGSPPAYAHTTIATVPPSSGSRGGAIPARISAVTSSATAMTNATTITATNPRGNQ